MLLKTILDILFPPFCIGCGKFGSVICTACLVRVPINYDTVCLICGRESLNGFTHASCLSYPIPERLISPLKYKGLARKAILAGKFGLKTFYVMESLTSLSLSQTGLKSLGPKTLVIPVPLHPNRRAQRGFNQAEVISKVLCSKLNLSLQTVVLLRRKNTNFQSRLTRVERAANVSEAFRVNPKYAHLLKGRDVLLVDDICTTGATFLSASKILKEAGARFVWCYSLAKA